MYDYDLDAIPFKLVLLGETAVGKSSLVLRFVRKQFNPYSESTVGAAFLTKTLRLDDGKTVKIEIWDTAGQEQFQSLAPMYFRDAAAGLVVYDITQGKTFEKAKDWVKRLQREGLGDVVIGLAGNKCDQEKLRDVETSVAQSFAEENNLIFFETSAKNDVNVNDIFVAIARKVPLQRQKPQDDIFNFDGGSGFIDEKNTNPNNKGRKQKLQNGGAGGGGGCC